MEKFKNVLNKRIVVMNTFNLLAVSFIALSNIYRATIYTKNVDIADMIHGFQVGIFIGLEFMMVMFVFRYRKALRSETELKKLYIEEMDERRKLIKDKIGGTGLNICLGGIATATIISGFFNEIVFLSLMGALIFMALVKGILKVYYRNKF